MPAAWPHDCDDHAWPLGTACPGCGTPVVACTACSEDLTDHRADPCATPREVRT